MRIGIDARELCGHATGVGRYLSGLIASWAADDRSRRHEFVLYAHAAIGVGLDTRRFATRTVPGTGGTWWEQVLAPAAASRDNLDVWFSPAYTAPLRMRVPLVVAVHDLSFVAHPEWFRLREGARRRWLCRRATVKSRAVITISDFSRRELIERLNVPAAKIHVIPPGIDSHRPTPSSRISSNPQSPIPNPDRILYVGSIFNRRHVGDLVRAFAPLARAHAGAVLDLVGDNRTHPREDLRRIIAAEHMERQVRWHEYVTDDQLAALFAGARAFAFLSEYEGLGLTPLEALASGVPPLLLDTPVARESCGDAALYVASNDLPAITRALDALLFDEAVRRRVLGAAPAALARYDGRKAACETLRVLEEAADATRSA